MADNRRIKCLTDQTAASVRGSQIIGSVARAVEELVHNSVEGCAKSLVITLGRSKLVISDDGLGIDPSAMKLFIGTEYCSNISNNAWGKKGETLRSIASLCVEMKIETACCAENTNNRKRKLDTEAPKSESHGSIIYSEKLFKNGVVVSFKQSTGGNTASSAIIPALNHPHKEKAGTTITIRGLFHQHAVRRKHSSFVGEEKSYAKELAQIRTCLRLLALSYPNVAFELRNGSTGKVDCSFKSPGWTDNYAGPVTSSLPAVASASPSLSVESRALILRLREIYPKEFAEEHSLSLEFEENRQQLNSNVVVESGLLANSTKGTNFRIFGALCISDDEDAVRNKELETVAINGRLATQKDKLADTILSQVTQCRRIKPNYSVRFFIHVSTRTGELVVKDSVATTSLPEVDRLAKFLKGMVAKAIVCDGMDGGSQSSTCGQNSRWIMEEKRVVNGERTSIVSSALNDTPQVEVTMKNSENTKPEESPPSPFSSAFFEPEEPSRSNSPAIKPKAKPDDDSRLLSFEDVFLDSPQTKLFGPATDVDFNDMEDAVVASSKWTKQRVKRLEGKIAAAAVASTGSQEKISLTKDMLAEAEVIAQVEEKFIIIKARGVLLCVDQHAADERIALEKLEGALFNQEAHDGMHRIIHMTHKSLMVSDILKCSKLIPPKRINLSQKDMATVRQHWSLIQKWKFTFEESDEKTLFLTGLASVCGRVTSTNDFVGFVKELGHFTGGEIRPTFVKNILASNACRYAIMFGDSMTHEQCVQLIASLSKCEFCFICAHGRPSVIPLIDMNKVAKSTREAFAHGKGDTAVKDGNLRFGPKRVIRH